MRTYSTTQGTLLDALGDLNGKEIQKRGDICIHIANSLCCLAENNNIKQLYSNNFF